MNPHAILVQTMMSQLKSRNPEMYRSISQAMENGVDPQQFMKQISQNATPEQMQEVLVKSKQLGVPENILSQIQNIK